MSKREGNAVDLDDLVDEIGADAMTYVADRVARYKQLRRLEITDQIPKSPSGKILRRILVEREREREKAKATGV